MFRPGMDQARPELKVEREFVTSKKTQRLIEDPVRRSSMVTEDSEVDNIIPKYEETEEADEEDETEEEKIRKLDELQNAREDILNFVNLKQQEKKEMEQSFIDASPDGQEIDEQD